VFQPMDTSNDLVERGYPLWFVCQNGYIGWFNFNFLDFTYTTAGTPFLVITHPSMILNLPAIVRLQQILDGRLVCQPNSLLSLTTKLGLSALGLRTNMWSITSGFIRLKEEPMDQLKGLTPDLWPRALTNKLA
jgi:hypothetical protein